MSVDTASIRSTESAVRTGTILAVCYSPDNPNGIFKQPRESAQFTRLGVVGDRHYGVTRGSGIDRSTDPNDRPITIASVEASRDICPRLGVPVLELGALGENMTIEGLGDMSDYEAGDRLRVFSANGEPTVLLEVVEQTTPCSKLQAHHRLMTKEFYGRRGVVCKVLQEGTVQPGDHIEYTKAG